MEEHKMTRAEELNKQALEELNNLEANGYFEKIEIIDEKINSNQDPFDKGFYLRQQDQLTEAYGEILVSYGKLNGLLKAYVSSRKFQMILEYNQSKMIIVGEEATTFSRTPADNLLEDLVQSEIQDLLEAVTLLEKGWLKRAENTIRTCRNHIYGENNGYK